MQDSKRDTDVKNRLLGSVGEDETRDGQIRKVYVCQVAEFRLYPSRDKKLIEGFPTEK